MITCFGGEIRTILIPFTPKIQVYNEEISAFLTGFIPSQTKRMEIFIGNGYFQGGGNSASLLKGIYSKRKSNFFPFIVDPFSERSWCARKLTGSHSCKQWWKIYQLYQAPLTITILSANTADDKLVKMIIFSLFFQENRS